MVISFVLPFARWRDHSLRGVPCRREHLCGCDVHLAQP